MKVFYALLALISAFLLYQIYTLYSLRHDLRDVDPAYTIGAKADQADIRVTEFLDYNCPYCEQMRPIITRATFEDGNAVYLPRPLAATGAPSSLPKAAIAYAAGQQGKFAEIQEYLYEDSVTINPENLQDVAERFALDADKLQEDFTSDATKRLIQKNRELFSQIGARATPTFIINKKYFYVPQNRMPTKDDFLAYFEEIRNRHN